MISILKNKQENVIENYFEIAYSCKINKHIVRFILLYFFQLVTTNEGLESKIKHLNEATEEEKSQEVRNELHTLQVSRKALQSEKSSLLKQIDALRVR